MSAGVLDVLRLTSVIPLDHPNAFVHWGWFSLSYSNAIVIGLMALTFVGAILIPFPLRGGGQGGAK